MKPPKRLFQFGALCVATFVGARLANAEPETEAPTVTSDSRFHADFEIDPVTYALSGDALHVGLGWERFRLDLSSFAMKLPSLIQTNDDFEVSLEGFATKFQVFIRDQQEGGFASLDAALFRTLVQRTGMDLAQRDDQVAVGISAGWRFALTSRLYATPWIGIMYSFSADDVTLDGATYEPKRINVFPAVHVGYRFR